MSIELSGPTASALGGHRGQTQGEGRHPGSVYGQEWGAGLDHPGEDDRVHFDIVRSPATGRRMAASVAPVKEPHQRRPLQEIIEDYPDRGLPRTECLAPGHYKG